MASFVKSRGVDLPGSLEEIFPGSSTSCSSRQAPKCCIIKRPTSVVAFGYISLTFHCLVFWISRKLVPCYFPFETPKFSLSKKTGTNAAPH